MCVSRKSYQKSSGKKYFILLHDDAGSPPFLPSTVVWYLGEELRSGFLNILVLREEDNLDTQVISMCHFLSF